MAIRILFDFLRIQNIYPSIFLEILKLIQYFKVHHIQSRQLKRKNTGTRYNFNFSISNCLSFSFVCLFSISLSLFLTQIVLFFFRLTVFETHILPFLLFQLLFEKRMFQMRCIPSCKNFSATNSNLLFFHSITSKSKLN